jgi:hypothetical protein
VLWLLTAIAFVVGAVGLWQHAGWGRTVTAGAALVSLPICLLSSPAAIAGVVVNVAILAVLALQGRRAR